MIAPHYRALVYSNLGQESQSTNKFGVVYLQVKAESFRRWSVRLDNKVCDKDERSHSVWVVPALYCAMRYIKNPRYLPGDKCKLDVRRIIPRTANVHFKAGSTKWRGNCRKYELLQVVALRNIKVGK